MNIDGAIDLAQCATPANAASGRNKLYFKNDDLPYMIGSAGAELGVGTRWGTTTTWHFADSTNVPVAFADGKQPRVGDLVVSTNGSSYGEVYPITAVTGSNLADIGPAILNIRGPTSVINPFIATKAADQTISTTSFVDLTDLSHGVTSAGTGSMWRCEASLDVTTSNAAWIGLIGLSVDGTVHGSQLIVQATVRWPGMKVWYVTGLAAGARTIKLQGRMYAASTNCQVRGGHSQFFVTQIA